jgi:hypothetical protein
LRFLKSTSVNWGTLDDGAGVTEAERAGVVLAGETAAGDDAPPAGEDAGGDSSWAKEMVLIKRAGIKVSRVLIN